MMCTYADKKKISRSNSFEVPSGKYKSKGTIYRQPFYRQLLKYKTKAPERRWWVSGQADDEDLTVNVLFTLLSSGVITY